MKTLSFLFLIGLLIQSFKVSSIVICTGTDEIYFEHTLNLIGSVHKNSYEDLQEILVYDLGLTQEQAKKIQAISKVTLCEIDKVNPKLLKHFRIDVHDKISRGWFAWKPVIIKKSLDKHPAVIYLDSGNIVLAPLDNLYKHIEQNGYFFIKGAHNIKDWTTQKVVKYFDLESEKNKFILDPNCTSVSANIIGVSKKYYDNLVLPMYNHAKDLSLFEDDGTSPGGFGRCRHDQTLWSIYAKLLNLQLFDQGYSILNVDGKKNIFHTHFESGAINPKTVIYQSRWDLNYGGKGLNQDEPYFIQFIKYKNGTEKITRSEQPKDDKKNLDNCADIIVFSYDRPMQIHSLLESIQKYIKGVNKIHIIYRSSSDKFEKSYNDCFKTFQNLNLNLVKQDHQHANDLFKPYVMNCLKSSKTKYILFAVDDIIVKDYIDLAECIEYLEKSNDYGFYLRLGLNITECYTENIPTPLPEYKEVDKQKGIYSVNFKDNKGDWGYPYSVDMTLYDRKTIIESIAKLNFCTPNRFEGNWHVADWLNAQNKDKNGLFYETSKIVNIPLNIVQTDCSSRNMGISKEELLNKYESGLKINIEPLFKINNKAPHIEYKDIQFIPMSDKFPYEQLYEAFKDLNLEKINKLKLQFSSLLEQKKTDVYNIKDENGYTPLMWAANCQNSKAAQFLIENGADVNAQDKNKCTALMFASWRANLEIVTLLIKNKADVNAIDTNGTTALIFADGSDSPNKEEVIALLID